MQPETVRPGPPKAPISDGSRMTALRELGREYWANRPMELAAALSYYKVMPDAPVAWRDVWVGAIITAVLFTIGKSLIGLYLGRSSIGSPYGAAGSLVVMTVWVFYASLIVFFGAEVTYFRSQHRR